MYLKFCGYFSTFAFVSITDHENTQTCMKQLAILSVKIACVYRVFV